tara:strand:+ start:77 stop:646 length:570 start_codon:yes stop_codon:yes gene_type:complete
MLFFAILKLASMTTLTDRGELDEARRVAQSILEQEELFRARPQNECVCYLGYLARTNTVLGDTKKARQLTEELLAGTDWTQVQKTRILGEIGAEQAADIAFEALAKNPNWNGFDAIAVEYLFYRNFLSLPRVQEYYVKQDKWIDYLAARIREVQALGEGRFSQANSKSWSSYFPISSRAVHLMGTDHVC